MSLKKFGKRVKKNKMDKFYTRPEVSKVLVQKLQELYSFEDFDAFLEPSAGSGSFLMCLPKDKRMGIDLMPENEEVLEFDFLKWEHDKSKRYFVIGNPPFGRVSSLAVKFFQKSAEFADVIAFIVPRTFRRVSVQNRLDKRFHLVYDEEIPLKPCAFSPEMNAKCCFQVWEKRSEKREKVDLPKKHKDWDFLSFGPLDENNQPTPPFGASFAIKAYGSGCGGIVTEGLENLRPKSWHWIFSEKPDDIIQRFKQLDYSISKDTARQDSLGRSELVWLYNQHFADRTKTG